MPTSPSSPSHDVPPGRVWLRVLGGFVVIGADGAPVTPLAAQPKRAALLATLALGRPGEPWRREVLADLLWPDLPAERGRAALRRALSHLRGLVGVAAIATHGDEFVCLDPAHVGCDLWTLAAGAAVGGEAAAEALTAYAGPLLPGLRTDAAPEWERRVEHERARARHLARDAAAALARDAAHARDAPAAVTWARRAAEIDPEDEATLRLLLGTLVLADDAPGAVRAYARYAAWLRTELQVEPAPATQALAAQAREAAARRPAAPSPAAPSPAAPSPAAPSPAAPSPAAPSPAAPSPAVPSAARVAANAPGQTPAATPMSEPARADVPTGIPPAGVPRRRGRLWRAVIGAAGAAAVVVAGAWAARRAQAGEARVTAAPPAAAGWPALERAGAAERTRLAVFPFTVRGDPAFQYLGDGVAELLGAPLEGTGVLHVIDPRMLPASDGGGDDVPLDSARTRARRVGADRFVLGTVVAAPGGRLQLAATVYDAAGAATGRALSAAVPEAELFAAVDTLARQLVGLTAGDRAGAMGRLAAGTTRSLPALRSYLAGERAFGLGRFDAAASHFGAAVEADTAFGLAYYRLGLAIDFGGNFRQDWTRQRAAEHARAHAGQLPERERELLTAYFERADARMAEADVRLRRLVTRYPDAVAAWHEWGELRFHSGHELAEPMRSARAMYERTIALDPGNVSARVHLARLEARAGRRAAFDALVGWLERRAPAEPSLPELRYLALALDGAPARLDSAALALARATPPTDVGAQNALAVRAWRAALFTGRPDAGLPLWAVLDAPGRPADVRLLARLARAHAEAGRGRWAAADSALVAAAALDAAAADEVRAGFAAFAEAPPGWDAGPLGRGAPARPAGAFAAGTDQPTFRAARQLRPVLEPFLRGVLAARGGRTADARGHLAAVRRAAPALPAELGPAGRALGYELEAALALAAGDGAAAVRLGALGWAATPRLPSLFAYPLPARVLARAAWARAAGDRAGALRWCDAAEVDVGLGDALAPLVARCRAGR